MHKSSSKKPLNLFLARLTPAIWAQFNGFYEKRKLDYRPFVPNRGMWIVDGQELVDVPMGSDREGKPIVEKSPLLYAGCCIFASDGPYAIVEFVSTNPEAPLRIVHRAVSLICHALSYWSSIEGKTAMCFPVDKGVRRMMEKANFHRTKPALDRVMYPPPMGVPVWYEKGNLNGAEPEPATMVAEHG